MCNIILCCILFLWVMPTKSKVGALESNGGIEEVKVGLVDLNSSMGVMVESCIAMAQSDFYKSHPSYRTKLAFHTKNYDNVLAAASGALELLKNEEVRAVLGPLTSPEAKFVVELGEKAQVPIVSFSATSSNISPLQSPYFIRTAAADSSQLKAVTTLFQGFEWKKVIIVYEYTGYQDGFIRDIAYAFQEAGIKISGMSAVPASANDSQIMNELNKLKAMPTRVFLVHMTSLLGSRIFVHAKTIGMMRKGYGWLMTDELSNLLNSMDDEAINAMEGVLGIRPYVPKSKDLAALTMRQEMELQSSKPKAVLNIFGLWAYDAVWALAMAVETIGPIKSAFVKQSKRQNASDMASLGSSDVGPVLKEILSTRFNGLSGEFNLVNGQLQISAFEILHVIGKGERTIGYWTPDRGLSRHPHSTNKSSNYSTSVSVLKNIIWPGDTTVKPVDWDLPTSGKKLKVGVPVAGFTEFVKLEQNPNSKEYSITGFCADIFSEVLAILPFKIDEPRFIPFQDRAGKSAGSYNDLLKQLELKKYDLVVADVTILPERAQRVDFSRPYMETEVVMLRQIKFNKGKDIWIFIKPLSSDLWLTIALTCILMGLIIRTLERRVNIGQQLGMFVWFPLASLAFPERNMVASNWSKFVLVIWLFTAFIVMQSYTANLSSILTIAQLKRSTDKPFCIGFQDGSFVRELLIDRLHFNESKMKSYATAEQYHDALSKGCHNGGVDAIFDELPFIKIFIDTYGETNYKLEGSSYSTGGLGFAFQKGSPLASIISMAILNLTGSGAMHAIMTKNFGLEYSDRNYFPDISSYSSSIGVENLAGLFIISGSMTLFALLFSAPSFQRLYASMSLHYRQNFVFPFPPSDNIETLAQSSAETIVNGDLSTTAIHGDSISIPIQNDEDVVAENRRETENNSYNVNAVGQGDINHSSQVIA